MLQTPLIYQCSIEFRTTAAESRWNDASLPGVFPNGLCDAVKDGLAARDESGSLDELIALAIRLDNRHECRRKRSRLSPAVPSSRSLPPSLARTSPATLVVSGCSLALQLPLALQRNPCS